MPESKMNQWSPAEKIAELILELSADAQGQRRETAKDSPSFHNLAGAIAAHGKALALATTLQQREQLRAVIDQIPYWATTTLVERKADYYFLKEPR